MASAFNAAAAYVNLLDTAATVVSATSAQILTPPSLLLDPHVSRHWRGSGGISDDIIVDLGSTQSIDTIYGMGSNLTASGSTRLRVSSVDSTGAAGDEYESGAIVGKVDPNYGYAPFLLPTPVSGRYVRMGFSDASLSAIELGRMFIGLRTQFTYNFDYGWSIQRVDRSTRTKTRSGQTQVFRDNAYRTFDLPMNFVAPEDRYGLIEAMDIACGQNTDVLMISDPTSSNLGRDSIWGLVSDLTAIIQPNLAVFTKDYKIEERL